MLPVTRVVGLAVSFGEFHAMFSLQDARLVGDRFNLATVVDLLWLRNGCCVFLLLSWLQGVKLLFWRKHSKKQSLTKHSKKKTFLLENIPKDTALRSRLRNVNKLFPLTIDEEWRVFSNLRRRSGGWLVGLGGLKAKS